MKIEAINKKHQVNVNRFVSWNDKYDAIVSATDDNGGSKQEAAHNKASEYWHELPKREQLNIVKSNQLVKGCY